MCIFDITSLSFVLFCVTTFSSRLERLSYREKEKEPIDRIFGRDRSTDSLILGQTVCLQLELSRSIHSFALNLAIVQDHSSSRSLPRDFKYLAAEVHLFYSKNVSLKYLNP